MIKPTYDIEQLSKFEIIKDALIWRKSKLISEEQFANISALHKHNLYAPRFIIRLLLFIVTNFCINGFIGFFLLTFSLHELSDGVLRALAILFGIALIIAADKIVVKKNFHYKSGVVECFIYYGISMILGSIISFSDNNTHTFFIIGILLVTFYAIYFLDTLLTFAALIALGAYLFYILDSTKILLSFMPFIFIIIFGTLYFWAKKTSLNHIFLIWKNQLIMIQYFSLLVIYAAGNYLVVRELSIELMNLKIPEGGNIPFAILFYLTTSFTPLIYLYYGLKNRDKIFIRVSLIVIAFTVFTFKYYYSLGHPEITLTIAGIILLGVSIYILNLLKINYKGYTREKIFTEKWANLNAEGFLISQTMGGNTTNEKPFEGGGGQFGGGGASGQF